MVKLKTELSVGAIYEIWYHMNSILKELCEDVDMDVIDKDIAVVRTVFTRGSQIISILSEVK